MDLMLIKSVPIFRKLRDADLQRVADRCVRKNYQKGQIVFIEEEAGSTFFIIHRGRVKVSRTNDEGREVILSLLERGEFFGEMSLLDGKARSADVSALEFTELLLLHRADFLELVEEFPQIAVGLLRVLAERIRRSDTQIKSLSLQDAKGRVGSALMMLAESSGRERDGKMYIPRLPLQQDLANMAGTSRETISRVYKDLEDEGYVKREGRRLLFDNYEKFKTDFC